MSPRTVCDQKIMNGVLDFVAEDSVATIIRIVYVVAEDYKQWGEIRCFLKMLVA